MTIGENDVDGLLCKELPEFASSVKEHRADWPDEAMLYPLLSLLFDFAVREYNIADGMRKEVAQRAYAIVETALTEGSKPVRDCFAIQMLEPLIGDTNHESYPDLESVMGPASQRELRRMREWWKRQLALDEARRQINVKLGITVFSGIGQQDENNARAIADVDKWKQLRREDKESAYRTLAERWKEIRASMHAKLTITGPRESGFVLLR